MSIQFSQERPPIRLGASHGDRNETPVSVSFSLNIVLENPLLSRAFQAEIRYNSACRDEDSEGYCSVQYPHIGKAAESR